MPSFQSLNFKNVLCPVDMSELSNLALKYAYVGARFFKASLTILHAMHFDYPRYLSRELTTHVLKELKDAEAVVREEVETHTRRILGTDGQPPHIDIRYQVASLEPAEAINQVLENNQADLVVMGTHGYTGFKHWMLGSVTESVLHQSKVPVFTVRQKIDDFIDPLEPEAIPRIKHILCPCNLTEAAGRALGVAADMAARFEARLTVLWVPEDDAATDKAVFEDWLRNTIEDAYPYDVEIRRGRAPEEAFGLSRELGCDMIVIGAHHKMFEQGTIVGRTTELVLRHAPVPVLSVPNYMQAR